MTALRVEVPHANIERVPIGDWQEFERWFAGKGPQIRITDDYVKSVQILEGEGVDPLIVSVVAAVARGHPIRMILDHIHDELGER